MTKNSTAAVGEDTAAIGPSPLRERVVQFRGIAVTVSPLRIGQLPRFVAAMRPVLGELAASARGPDVAEFSADKVLDWIERYTDHLVAGLAAATGLPADQIRDAEAAEFLELATAVLRVNLDFFVQRLLPIAARAVPDLVAAADEIKVGSGETRSTL